jgi:hypothetical protein
MMEAEWFGSDDPLATVRFLHEQSDRKRGLFVVAWARAVWDQIPEGNPRQAVNTADRCADGWMSDGQPFQHRLAMEGVIVMLLRFAYLDGGVYDPRAVTVQGSFEEVFREIFGNPFHPVAFDPVWRMSDVMALAEGIYDERAFERMPILADALQDAGCDSDDILNHLRDPNAAHVRGCWALDPILGKE